MIAIASGSAIGGFLIVFLIVFLAFLGFWIWGIVDAAKRSSEAYVKAGSNKTLWIVLILVFGDPAVLIYALTIRPKLVAAEGK